MVFSNIVLIVFVVSVAIINAAAESHVIIFDNRCRFGTPTLRAQNGAVLSTGGSFTTNGPLIGAIAYLQTGGCGDTAEDCTLIEFTLRNPASPGASSTADINLIPPHTFSVTSGFKYFNGCDDVGAECDNPNCPTAAHFPSDKSMIICLANNVSLIITFCGDGPGPEIHR